MKDKQNLDKGLIKISNRADSITKSNFDNISAKELTAESLDNSALITDSVTTEFDLNSDSVDVNTNMCKDTQDINYMNLSELDSLISKIVKSDIAFDLYDTKKCYAEHEQLAVETPQLFFDDDSSIPVSHMEDQYVNKVVMSDVENPNICMNIGDVSLLILNVEDHSPSGLHTYTDDASTKINGDTMIESDDLSSFTESNAYNPLDPHLIIPIYTIYT